MTHWCSFTCPHSAVQSVNPMPSPSQLLPAYAPLTHTLDLLLTSQLAGCRPALLGLHQFTDLKTHARVVLFLPRRDLLVSAVFR